jgi:uncharacterized OsmC-like protein
MTEQSPPAGPSATTDAPRSTLRSVELTRIGQARFKATNARGGETFFGTGGEDPDFTPVELLLAAIAGCSALDVEAITHKRVSSTTYDVHAEGHKVRDQHGNHLVDLRVSFDIRFPEGPEGDAARERVQGAMEMSRDRLCTVARTVQLGAPITYEQVSRP